MYICSSCESKRVYRAHPVIDLFLLRFKRCRAITSTTTDKNRCSDWSLE